MLWFNLTANWDDLSARWFLIKKRILNCSLTIELKQSRGNLFQEDWIKRCEYYKIVLTTINPSENIRLVLFKLPKSKIR